MEQNMVVVSASDISKTITVSDKVAIYDILFCSACKGLRHCREPPGEQWRGVARPCGEQQQR